MQNNIKDAAKIKIFPPVREPGSKIIRYMTEQERSDIETELYAETTIWSNHPEFDPTNPRSNVFKYGKSCHIYNTSFSGEVAEDNRHLFPKTLAHIYGWTGYEPSKLGRTYWHKLIPGGRIDLHHDNSNEYFRTVDRYQVYLDVPTDFIVALDGRLWNVYPECRLQNAVVDFNLFDIHFFANYTEEPKYLLVFDFYPD